MKSSFEKGESSKEIKSGKKPRKKRGRPSKLTPEEKKKNKIESDRAYRLRKKTEVEELKKMELEHKMLKKMVEEKKVETEEDKVVLEEMQSGLNQIKDGHMEHLKVNLEIAQKEKTKGDAYWSQLTKSGCLEDIIQLPGNEDKYQITSETYNSEELEAMVNEMRDDNDIEMLFSSNVIGDHIVSMTTPPEAVLGPDDTAAVTPYEQSYPYIKTFDDHNRSLNQLEANYTQYANMSFDAIQKWVDGINEATTAGHNVDLVRSRFEHAAKTHLEQVEGVLGNMVEQRKAAELANAQNELRQFEEATKKARAKVAALGGNITSLDTTPGPGPSQN